MTRVLLLAATSLLACQGRILGDARGDTAPPEVVNPAEVPDASVPSLPAAALCSNAPSGRGYLGLAGEPLEVDRADQAALLDVDRPYRVFQKNGEWTLPRDVQKAIGSASFTDPERQDPGVGGSFGVAPDHWYAESEVGTFAVFTTFAYAFAACRRTIDAPPLAARAGWYEHTAFAPTAERARAYCQRAQREAWLRAPTVRELQACVDLSLNLAEEPDVKNQWAYVCASIIASANFLSF